MEWAKVLLVDHEQGTYEPLKQGLVKHGYEMHATDKVTQALALAGAHRYQAAFVSLAFVADSGLLTDLHAERPELPLIVILPPYHTDCLSPQVLKSATHVIGKPLRLDLVCLMLDRTLELVALRTQVRQHRQAWCDPLLSEASLQALDGPTERSSMPLDTLLVTKLRHIIPNLKVLGGGALHRAVLSYVEKLLLVVVLDEARGNQVRASEVLGINRNTLRKKIRDFDIEIPRGGS